MALVLEKGYCDKVYVFIYIESCENSGRLGVGGWALVIRVNCT